MGAAQQALVDLWLQAGLPSEALSRVALTGQDPVLPSSFAVGAAAQASIAAAALAATHVGVLRGLAPLAVSVDMQHAALECLTHYAIDGRVPDPWDKYSGVYRTADGWVRIHANFTHHRDGALALLGLKAGENVTQQAVEHALQAWRAEDFEQAAAALRTRIAHANSRSRDRLPDGFCSSGRCSAPARAGRRVACALKP
jgi:hypothetical protein